MRSTLSMLKYYGIKYVACVESQLVVHVRIMFTYLDHKYMRPVENYN